MCKYILVQQRKNMSPRMFECLIFLKVNRRFWDSRMVARAYNLAKLEKRNARVEKLAKDVEDELKLMEEVAAGLLSLQVG